MILSAKMSANLRSRSRSFLQLWAPLALLLIPFERALTKAFVLFFSDLKQSRLRILELLPDPHHDVPKMETAMKLYYSLIRGFLETSNYRGNTEASKLRHSLRFRWTQSLLGPQPEIQNDAVFEAANMMMNFAFWHMKHAAMVTAKPDLDMDEAKKVHTR